MSSIGLSSTAMSVADGTVLSGRKDRLRFAAEQRWLIACGETAGYGHYEKAKLRSSGVDSMASRTSLLRSFMMLVDWIPWARAQGYQPQLLRSQSQSAKSIDPFTMPAGRKYQVRHTYSNSEGTSPPGTRCVGRPDRSMIESSTLSPIA
jgi:hypothetical protein